MEWASLTFVGVLVAATFLYAVWPLLRPAADGAAFLDWDAGAGSSDRMIARLLLDRDQAYKNIMDIEFDKEMGKLSEEDYAEMIAPARARALGVLRRLEARGVGEGMVSVRVDPKVVEREAARLVQASPAAAQPPPPPVSSEKEKSLDERLEEEILRYRKVPPGGSQTPAAQAAGQAAATGGAERPEAAAPAERYCPSCGVPVGADHIFCASCGAKLS